MTMLLAITGSYREGGITDQAVAVAVETARRAGAGAEVVDLRNQPIEFCLNCRQCMQTSGEAPGECVHHDGMATLVERIEAADCLVLASPTNFYSVTALFKRFMERLAVYAYWPWGQHAPKLRKTPSKKVLVITSGAAPAIVGRLFFSSLRQLRATAKTIGGKPVGLFIGLAAGTPSSQLRASDVRQIERATARML